MRLLVSPVLCSPALRCCALCCLLCPILCSVLSPVLCRAVLRRGVLCRVSTALTTATERTPGQPGEVSRREEKKIIWVTQTGNMKRDIAHPQEKRRQPQKTLQKLKKLKKENIFQLKKMAVFKKGCFSVIFLFLLKKNSVPSLT